MSEQADPWSTTFRRRRVHREMSCNKGPEFVGNQCFGHGIGPAKNRPSILMPGPWLRTAEIDPKQTFAVHYLAYFFAATTQSTAPSVTASIT
jgi:hypothetical protein